MIKFRNLKPDEIELKVGNVGKKGYTLMMYKNARCDMAILDETVGAENWQRKHYEVKDNMYCSVGININWDKPDKEPYFVWKDDCGVESAFGDKEKGEASDSFKRACVNWGIGRELYSKVFIFICAITKQKEGGKGYEIAEDAEKYRKFNVSNINYNDKGEIIGVEICDNDGQVFTYGQNNTKPKEDKPLIVGGKYILNGGKYPSETIEQVYKKDSEYLEKLMASDKVSKVIKDNIDKFLSEV